MASSGWGVYNFVIENGEVESEPEPDGMRRLHFGLGYVKRFLVCLLGVFHDRCNANQPPYIEKKSFTLDWLQVGLIFRKEKITYFE